MSDIFPPNSRYRGVPCRKRTNADGTEEIYVGRRIIPAVERYRILDRHRTKGGSRIDDAAATSFGDPELYWRICDANGDDDPAHAMEPEGRLLVIPLPLEISDHGNP